MRELGFNYMRGEFAHSGFPEQAFGRMSTTLIERGYKVARIEQTETPATMEDRVKEMAKNGIRTTKFDKVVRREVCQVVNRGTQVFGQLVEISNEYQPKYLLAVVEKVLNITLFYSTANLIELFLHSHRRLHIALVLCSSTHQLVNSMLVNSMTTNNVHVYLP